MAEVDATIPVGAELISQGAARNGYAQLLVHVTINPDGTVTSVVDNLTASCHG